MIWGEIGINKWCLSILKLFEVDKKKLSLKKKRFCISLDTRKFFQQIMALGFLKNTAYSFLLIMTFHAWDVDKFS